MIIDINKTVRRLIPVFLRTDGMRSWLEALLSPLQTLNFDFVAFVEDKRSEMKYTGQTIQLERFLNDLFDSAQRRISIIHASKVREFDYLYIESQSYDFDYFASEAASDRYIRYATEAAESSISADFKINIPIALNVKNDQINANVERFRISGIAYEINYY